MFPCRDVWNVVCIHLCKVQNQKMNFATCLQIAKARKDCPRSQTQEGWIFFFRPATKQPQIQHPSWKRLNPTPPSTIFPSAFIAIQLLQCNQKSKVGTPKKSTKRNHGACKTPKNLGHSQPKKHGKNLSSIKSSSPNSIHIPGHDKVQPNSYFNNLSFLTAIQPLQYNYDPGEQNHAMFPCRNVCNCSSTKSFRIAISVNLGTRRWPSPLTCKLQNTKNPEETSTFRNPRSITKLHKTTENDKSNISFPQSFFSSLQ